MKEMVKNALILFAITVIAGGILGAVYQVTKEPIQAAEEQARLDAYREVFQDAEKFYELPMKENDGILEEGGYTEADIDSVLEATDFKGNILGYVVVLTSHEGYAGDIKIAAGITEDGTLNGISILEIAETPGLGMEAESVLKPQFAGKKVEKFEYTKTGASSENQIDAISGATRTTNAVTNGVNAALYYMKNCEIKEGGAGNE